MDILFFKIFSYIRPVLEIGFMTILIYYVLYFLRGARASNILAGIVIILIILNLVSNALNFEVISWLLNSLWAILATAMIVIFQPELRRAFAQLGSTPFTHKTIKKKEAINEVITALLSMSQKRIGALIVFERQIGMAFIVNNAVQLDIKLNALLIESIFYPNSPLHDGAMIIKDDKIVAAHAILPLSQDPHVTKTLGTRHRAAIGITEETDAVAVLVSEETGGISIAFRGQLKKHVTTEQLKRTLGNILIPDEKDILKNIFGTMEENDQMEMAFSSGENKNND